MVVGGQHHTWAAFTQERSQSTNLTGGWEGLRAALDECLKSHPHRGLNPKSSIPLPDLITLTISYHMTHTNYKFTGM